MASRNRKTSPRATLDVETRWVRPRVGMAGVLRREGAALVSLKSARALIDSGQAVEVCGKDREIQIASLCSAAHELDVTLTTKDADIDDAATRYGARCNLVGQK